MHQNRKKKHSILIFAIFFYRYQETEIANYSQVFLNSGFEIVTLKDFNRQNSHDVVYQTFMQRLFGHSR